jgi:hypothetical protein
VLHVVAQADEGALGGQPAEANAVLRVSPAARASDEAGDGPTCSIAR